MMSVDNTDAATKCAEEFLKEKLGLPANNKVKILVAVSGGADSVCLLFVLRSLCEKYCFSVEACHVNHMIRANEANRDEDFVVSLCEKLGVRLHRASFDVIRAAAEKKNGIEECAREIRYAYFERLKTEFSFDYIATAHNANDNAETMLFHLFRGSGVSGLCGIRPIRGHYIRPLYLVTRSQIEEYLKENKLDHVTDSTNSDVKYSRNLIRHLIVPQIEKINPDHTKAFSQSAQIFSDIEKYLAHQVSEHYSDNTRDILSFDTALAREIIREIHFRTTSLSLSYQSTNLVLCACSQYASTKKITKRCIENGISVEVGEKVRFYKTEKNEKDKRKEFNIKLNSGKNIINDKYALFIDDGDDVPQFVSDFHNSEEIIYKLSKKVYIVSATITKEIYARSRIDGDRISYFSHSRKLKELFINAKIPRNERDLVPVVYCGDEIIYVGHFPAADKFRSDTFIKNKTVTLGFYVSDHLL